MELFSEDEDYSAFEGLLEETLEACPMRICAYCLMPNHWHFVMWPEGDGDLSAFMQRLTTKHVRRWQLHREVVGYGHVYQSRYKSFPIEREEYFYRVVRYVERNPLRAGLVDRAERWRWSSLWRRVAGNGEHQRLLSAWPVDFPRDWCKWVNEPQTEAEVDAIRRCVLRGQPFGGEQWVQQTSQSLGLESALREPHRPKKAAPQ